MAGKFNLSDIAGLEEIKVSTDIKESGIAEDMLSEMSRSQKVQDRRTTFIKYDDLVPYELNKYMSMEHIEELAEQIRCDGLDQPLVVCSLGNGKYTILSGGRRHAAIGLLIQNGKYDSDRLVECKVKDNDFKNSKNSLSLEDKKILTWLTTNEYRNDTDADIFLKSKYWKQIITKMRANGDSILVAGYDENGDPIEKDIRGVKTRELVATQVGISDGKQGKIDKILNKGTDELQTAVKEQRVDINVAADISSLKEDEQKEFLHRNLLKSKIHLSDVRHFKELSKEENDKVVKEDIDTKNIGVMSEGEFILSVKDIKKSIKNITTAIKEIDAVKMDQKDYDAYKRYMNELDKLFTKIK